MTWCHPDPSPEKSSAGLSSFSLRVLSKWDRSRLVGSLASSTSSGEKKQGDLLPLEPGTPRASSHKLLLGRGHGGAHPPPSPRARRAPRQLPLPLAHRAVSLLQRLLEAWQRLPGECRGNCLAPRGGWQGRHAVPPRGERGLAARGECEGRAWKGVPARGRWVSTRGTHCPVGPLPTPAAAALPGLSLRCGRAPLCLPVRLSTLPPCPSVRSASLSVRSPGKQRIEPKTGGRTRLGLALELTSLTPPGCLTTSPTSAPSSGWSPVCGPLPRGGPGDPVAPYQAQGA